MVVVGFFFLNMVCLSLFHKSISDKNIVFLENKPLPSIPEKLLKPHP